MRLRAETRSRWRSWLLLAVMLGVVGGAVLTATAGARRTDSAYPRMRAEGHSADVLVSVNGSGLHGFYDALASLPGVAADAQGVIFNTAGLRSSDGRFDPNVQVEGGVDANLGFTMSQPKVLEGRMFHPQSTDEAVIDPQLAALHHLHPGSRLTLYALPQNFTGTPDIAHAIRFVVRVTGVVVFDNKVVPVSQTDQFSEIVTSPALVHHTDPSLFGADGAYLRLRPGTDISVLHKQVDALAAKYPADQVGGAYFANLDDQTAAVQRAVRPEVVALTLFAVLLGLVGLVVLGQLLARQLSAEASEYATLSALGASRRQLLALSLLRAAVIAVAGAVLAIVVAIAASPLMPIGPARLAELDPGVQIDQAVMVFGLVLIILLTMLVVLPSAWRAASTPVAPGAEVLASRSSSGLTRLLAGVQHPISLFVGLRMALQPGTGRGNVPLRSAVVGTTVALAAITGAIVFGSSLDALISTPARYGQPWNVTMTSFGAPPKSLAKMIAAHVGHVDAYAGGTFGEAIIGGRLVPAVGIDRIRGDVFPSLLEGRAPDRPTEIALGARTMRDAHTQVGGWVKVGVNGKARSMHVVGEAIFPAFSRGSFTPTDLGEGAVTTTAVFPAETPDGTGLGFNLLAFRLAPGTATQQGAKNLSAVLTKIGCPIGACFVTTDLRPPDISDYARVRQTPFILALVLGSLGVATLAYVLVSSIRRRRRDLAMLKTLGFVRSQVSIAVAWQSSALAAIALLLGIPIGIALGRWVWALFANSVGVANDATVPLFPVLIMIPAVLLLANLIALGPGLAAGRVKAAAVLRTE